MDIKNLKFGVSDDMQRHYTIRKVNGDIISQEGLCWSNVDGVRLFSDNLIRFISFDSAEKIKDEFNKENPDVSLIIMEHPKAHPVTDFKY
jgi:hypothetical protein